MQTLGLKHWLNRPTTLKKIVWSIQSQKFKIQSFHHSPVFLEIGRLHILLPIKVRNIENKS